MLFISEITDFRRFAAPRALMAFLGLRLPREKRRNKAFVLLYNQGHENYKQYQREAEHP